MQLDALGSDPGGPYEEPPADEWDAELIRDAAEMAHDTDILAIQWAVADDPERHRYPWESAAAWEWLEAHGYDTGALMAALTVKTGPITPT